MKRLKAATHEDHDRMESLNYFSALSEKQLPIESYIAHLKAFAVILGVLEKELSICADRRVKSVSKCVTPKLPWLISDLKYLRGRRTVRVESVIRKAMDLTMAIRLKAISDPMALLGYLYVFEGSTHGAALMRQSFIEQFDFPEFEGTLYFNSYGKQVKKNWRTFRERMEACVVEQGDQLTVEETAKQTFRHLAEIFEECYPPYLEEGDLDIADINPEAGMHPIPDDPVEVIAAIEAGNKCLQEFPYFNWRYGERGDRFAYSDSAWLATLCSQQQSGVDREIDWLCGILVPRGMPRFLMERHLVHLHRELCSAVAEKRKSFDKLKYSADRLQEVRHSKLNQSEFKRLARDIDKKLLALSTDRVKGLGSILVSAVIDEETGMQGALDGLLGWLADENLFDEDWCAAVHASVNSIKESIYKEIG